MNDQTDTSNGGKTLRDRFPIYCDVCGKKIVGGQAYRIVSIRAGTGDKPLAENVYQHRECADTQS